MLAGVESGFDAIAYIRGDASCLPSVQLFLQLIVPTRLFGEAKKRVELETGKQLEEILPDFQRIVVFEQRGLRSGYLVAMNGYVFYILFSNPENTAAEYRSLEKRFYAATPGAKRLDPSTANTVIYPSSLSMVDVAKNASFLRSNVARTARWVKERQSQPK